MRPRQFALDLGRQLAEAGADLAANNAGFAWRFEAIRLAKSYIAEIGRPFQMAEVRRFAETTGGLPPPPEPRAWGAIAKQLRREGVIKSVGVARSFDPRQHAGFTTEWVATNDASFRRVA